MATTEEWIEWSRSFSSPYWATNHQLFLEVAAACCRWYRDEGGLSTVPELANAEHYWSMRWWCFGMGGAVGDVVATPMEALSPAVASVVGQVGAYTGMAATGLSMSAAAVVWDLFKRDMFARRLERFIPGGDAPASRPSVDQIFWAVNGFADALVLDAPYMSEMRWASVLRDLPGTLTLPPPLR